MKKNAVALILFSLLSNSSVFASRCLDVVPKIKEEFNDIGWEIRSISVKHCATSVTGKEPKNFKAPSGPMYGDESTSAPEVQSSSACAVIVEGGLLGIIFVSDEANNLEFSTSISMKVGEESEGEGIWLSGTGKDKRNPDHRIGVDYYSQSEVIRIRRYKSELRANHYTHDFQVSCL